MPISDATIIGSDDAYDELMGICRDIRERVIIVNQILEKSKSTETGLIALIASLNRLALIDQQTVYNTVPLPMIEYSLENFNLWYERVKKKIPNEFADEFYQKSKNEIVLYIENHKKFGK